jgi:catechol 2,3-dioxygenase-like lactoylglutathione lyase family enzyme
MANALPTIRISVHDLDRSVAFYLETFGLDCLGRDGRSALLSDFAHVRLSLSAEEDMPRWTGKPRTIAEKGFSNLTFHVNSLGDTIDRAAAAGGTIHDESRVALAPGIDGVFMADPDGVPLELVSGKSAPCLRHAVFGVRDLHRAAAVYEALHYTRTREIDISTPQPAISQLTRLPGLRLRGLILNHADGGEIELIELLHPLPPGLASTTALPWPGFRNICFTMEAVEQTASAIEAAGALRKTTGVDRGQACWWGGDVDGTPIMLSADRD